MPYFTRDGVELYYETDGDPTAPPLLIIPGLGDTAPKCGWQSTELAEDFFVITIENRGAGRSTQPPPGYTAADMAEDARELLDRLGLDRVHVFGFSLGGMIALNLAVRHPERIQSLALGCTTAGGDMAVSPQNAVTAAMLNPVSSGDPMQDYMDGLWISCAPEFVDDNPQTIRTLANLALEHPQSPLGYAGQLQAVMSHHVTQDLDQLTMPVLVLHGDADLLLPVQNGMVLAEAIPNSRLILYPGAGHLFFIEEAEAVNRDLHQFFSQSDSGQAS